MIILGPQYLFVGRPRKLLAPELRAYSRTVLNQGHPLIQANIANIHVEEQENIEVPKITSNLSALGQDRLVLHMEGIILYSCFFFSTQFSIQPFLATTGTRFVQLQTNKFQGLFKEFSRTNYNFQGVRFIE